jgi:TetR/AcrR family transcriptional regulator, transcriptional repressor of bet genes
MGRKNISEIRRTQITEAFAEVMGEYGYSCTTMIAVAEAAGVSPGLLHHYFDNKREMLIELIRNLKDQFRARFEQRVKEVLDPLDAYLQVSLKIDERSDFKAAKCWVGIFAEAIKDPDIHDEVSKYMNEHLKILEKASQSKLHERERAALLAQVTGSLVLGSFAAKGIAGFAYPNARMLLNSLLEN